MDGRYPPYPGILWTLLKSVPDGIQDLSGFWGVHGLVHPVIPSGRLCALFPAFLGLRYRCSRLYTTTSWEALSGYASWEGPGDPLSLEGGTLPPGGGVVSWDGVPRPGGVALPIGGWGRRR